MQKFLKNLFTAQRCRRAMFFLLFAAVMLLNSSPELRADALYLIADGDTVSVLDGTTDIPQERVIVAGAQSGDAEVTLPAGEKVTVTHGDDIEYATTRNGERVSELLRRLQISVSPLEMVLVDVTEEEVEITVASDFTYYETATEAAPHTTLTSTSYRIPKGETQIVQQGIDGTRDVVYEVVYADGQFVSRQAVEEKNLRRGDHLHRHARRQGAERRHGQVRCHRERRQRLSSDEVRRFRPLLRLDEGHLHGLYRGLRRRGHQNGHGHDGPRRRRSPRRHRRSG